MKTITVQVLTIVSCMFLIVMPAASEQPAPQEMIQVTTSVPASNTLAIPIVTCKGNQFTITLPANHTTGYRWQLANKPDTAVVKFVGSIYNESKKENMVGQGGNEVWTFQGVDKGSTTIVLNYVRPWEKDVKPEMTQTFSVSVQ